MFKIQLGNHQYVGTELFSSVADGVKTIKSIYPNENFEDEYLKEKVKPYVNNAKAAKSQNRGD